MNISSNQSPAFQLCPNVGAPFYWLTGLLADRVNGINEQIKRLSFRRYSRI